MRPLPPLDFKGLVRGRGLYRDAGFTTTLHSLIGSVGSRGQRGSPGLPGPKGSPGLTETGPPGKPGLKGNVTVYSFKQNNKIRERCSNPMEKSQLYMCYCIVIAIFH